MDGFQRTQLAVHRQLAAMDAPGYEVGIYQQKMMIRVYSPSQLLNSIGWLRHKNATGHHIYIRPADSLGIVLLDDLDSQSISRLRRAGLEPAVVLETSPNNYQCWIRLIHNHQRRPICSDLIGKLLTKLAADYDADPHCADWRHFGRLAGFTNQKPAHRHHGRAPFVLLRYAQSIVATHGRAHLIQMRHAATEPLIKQSPNGRIRCDAYACRQQRILSVNSRQPWALHPDQSRLDYMIARQMLLEGHPHDHVLNVLRSSSPHLTDRKAGHVDDYLKRTLKAARSASHPFSHPLQ